MKKIILLSLILILMIVPSINAALAPAIVYKTKANYNDLVPIGLSEDNLRIESHPDQVMLYYKGELADPTSLS